MAPPETVSRARPSSANCRMGSAARTRTWTLCRCHSVPFYRPNLTLHQHKSQVHSSERKDRCSEEECRQFVQKRITELSNESCIHLGQTEAVDSSHTKPAGLESRSRG